MGYATPPTLINKFSHPKFIGQHNNIDRLRHAFNNNHRVIAGHHQRIPLRLATLLKSRRGQVANRSLSSCGRCHFMGVLS